VGNVGRGRPGDGAKARTRRRRRDRDERPGPDRRGDPFLMARRRRLPSELVPAYESFRTTLRIVDEAKRCLTEAVPSTRLPGRPLADALSDFESLLDRARQEMRSWFRPELEAAWSAADRGVASALDRATKLREGATIPQGFEGLISTLGDLVDPLD